MVGISNTEGHEVLPLHKIVLPNDNSLAIFGRKHFKHSWGISVANLKTHTLLDI